MAGERRCRDCRFFVERGLDKPECRRQPPKPSGGYARVESYDWCGEWQSRDALSPSDRIERLEAALTRARAFVNACVEAGELTPNESAENPCDVVEAIDAALQPKESA